MKSRGFTDKLAIFIVALLTVFVLLSFALAVYSIRTQYVGALACWTVCVTPLGAGLDVVLNSVVQKNRAENTGPNNEGLRFRQLTTEEGGNYD